MNKRKRNLTTYGLIAALLVIRAGECLVDYAIGDQDGHLSTPVLSFGLSMIYHLLLMSIIILGFLRIRTWLSSHYPGTVKNFPVLSDTPFRIGLFPLLIAAIGMNAVLFINNPNFGTDAYAYYFPVHNFMNGQEYTASGHLSLLPPGYGFFSYLFFLVTHDIELSTMLVSSFSYVLSVVVAYYAGTLLAGRLAGFLAAFFITFCPMIVRYSFTSLIDMCYVFFALCSFFVYIKIVLHKPNYFRSILLGFLLGCTLAIREQGLVLAVGAIFSLFLFTIIQLKTEKQLRFALLWKPLSYPILTLIMTTMLLFLQMYPTYSMNKKWVVYARYYKTLLSRSLDIPDQYATSKQSRREYFFDVLEDDSATHNINIFAYNPISMKLILSNAVIAYKHVVHIIIHAVIPLILMAWIALCYVFVGLLTEKTFLLHWKMDTHNAKILLAFLIFISPIAIPIIFKHVHVPRYILEHSGFFLVLSAVVIVKLLSFLSKKYASYGVLIVCVISSLTFIGVPSNISWVRSSIIFHNRLLPVPRYYFTLTTAFKTNPGHPGLRAAGLWLAHNYTGNIDTLTVMAPGRQMLVLFYASGRQKEPQGTAIRIPEDLTVHNVAEKMKTENIEYLILTRNKQRENFMPLWENPGLAREIGLKLIHNDPDGGFQLYSL